MKKKLLVIILVTILLGLVSCNSEKDNYQIITVKFGGKERDPSSGGEKNSVTVASTWYFKYLSDEKGQISLPLLNYDVLEIRDNVYSGASTIYEYCTKDGNELEFLINDSMTTLNGHVITIVYDGDPAAENILSSLSDDEIKRLKYLVIKKYPFPTDLPQLDRVARINPHIGIMAKDTAIIMALDIFSPEFLYVMDDNCCEAEVNEKICSAESIERLMIDSYYAFDLNTILKLPHLRKLDIQCLEKFDTNLRLIGNSSLEMLSINGSKFDFKIHNFNFLLNLNNLKHLVINGSETCLNLNSLQKLNKLKSVILTGDSVAGFSSLNDLHSLESFYFPYNISQQDFNAFISDHPELNSIGLIGCENVTDLAPLMNLKNLEFLLLNPLDSGFTAESLKGFNNLGYLSIGPVKDSTLMPEIRAMLPYTIVNGNTGMCLGSGYLLFIIPLFLFFAVISMIYRRRYS